jgi:hypothetical protein
MSTGGHAGLPPRTSCADAAGSSLHQRGEPRLACPAGAPGRDPSPVAASCVLQCWIALLIML